jgi:hypothetical protein
MLFDVTLHPSQKVRIYRITKDSSALVRSCNLDSSCIAVTTLSNRDGELLHEHGHSSQFARINEIEEGPKFLQVILQRRS